MQKPQIILGDRLYVPAEYVTPEMIDAFESQVQIGYDKIAKTAIYTTLQHYQVTEITRGNTIYTFNRGNMALINSVFGPYFDIVDQRISLPMLHPLKLVFPEGRDWREYQPEAVEALLQKDYGILKAPARSGKTVMLTAAICAEREKTLVLAHQTDLLLQFLDTFEEYTNLLELQAKTGEKIVGLAEEWEDFDTLDVAFCTKQTFDNFKNRQQLPLVQKSFGQVYVDEVHYTSADLYSTYVNRFWAKRRQGCTATTKIKSMLDVQTEFIVGPEIHTIDISEVGRPPIKVRFRMTGISAQRKAYDYISMLTMLAGAEGRNLLMAETIAQQVQAGHTIIGVTDRKNHCKLLQQRLQGLGVNTVIFTGDTQNRKHRKDILNKVRSRTAPVMIAMRSMTTGLDIPRADVFHNLMPSANAVGKGLNQGEGGYEQQCSRVLTQFPGKEVAYIDDWIDNIDIAWGCKKVREKTYAKIGAIMEIDEKSKPYQPSLFMNSGGSSTEF